MGIPYAEVIGDPIVQSKSPLIHKYWLEKLGIEGEYRATRVTAAELPDYLAARRADPDWRGCNVTMPHKEVVLPLLDEVSWPELGAVNCIVPRSGRLYGSNTDGAGVNDATIEWDIGYGDSRICLIGAGGAARAAIAELDVQCYFIFDLIARDRAKGRAFLDSCNVEGEVYSFEDAASAMADRDAVINASPLGMIGFAPMPDSVLDALPLVRAPRPVEGHKAFAFDMVTAPARTAFIARAEATGLTVSDGLTMLIGQARSAFRAFFGVVPPEGDTELRRLLTS